jgi:hypothetical protein
MNGQLTANQRRHFVIASALLLLATGAVAQVPVDENGEPIGRWEATAASPAVAESSGETVYSAAELADLVGPVALYPDDLLAIVLPASTYPLEIVKAARFLDALDQDASLEPDEAWDDAVVALLNYPEVVRMMNEDIDWTWQLGEAVISQQDDVIAAVEAFRDRAYAAGNLASDGHQKVSHEDGVIQIVPVSEEIIHVPYYEPAEVIVRQSRPVYYYYPDPYPVYYYPYPVGYRFHARRFWGVTTAFTIGWPNRYLHVHHPSYWGHPYYGRYYFGHYYRRPSITVYNRWYVNDRHRAPRHRYRDGDYWRPRYRAGVRQHRVVNRHYTTRETRRAVNREITRRTTVRTRNDGRLDLNLRDRRQDGATIRRSHRDARAADRHSTARNRSTSTAGNNRPRAGTARSRAAERDRRDLAIRSPRPSVNTNRRASSGARAERARGNWRREAAPRRPAVVAQRTQPRATHRAAPSRPIAANQRRSSPPAKRQRTESTRGRDAGASSRRSTSSRARSRQRH